MAHTLTWSNNISTVTVNGTTVSQPYTLKDGDVIEAYVIASSGTGITLVNSEVCGSPIDLSEQDIYIDYSMGGGSN